MKKREIPEAVIYFANRLCFDTVKNVGVYKSKTVFTLTLSMCKCPTGLPNILLWDGKEVTYIKGERAIDILNEIMR